MTDPTQTAREAAERRSRMAQHKLVDGTLKCTDHGIIARCVCGWSSGYRFSSMLASAAFMDHQEEAENAVEGA